MHRRHEHQYTKVDSTEDLHFANAHFWTTTLQDNDQGYSGLRLHQKVGGKTTVAAEVLFWNASGMFYFRTVEGDLPVEIVERLITEPRDAVKDR